MIEEERHSMDYFPNHHLKQDISILGIRWFSGGESTIQLFQSFADAAVVAFSFAG
jgi:hypothetical protein